MKATPIDPPTDTDTISTSSPLDNPPSTTLENTESPNLPTNFVMPFIGLIIATVLIRGRKT